MKYWLSPDRQKEELCHAELLAVTSRCLTRRMPRQVRQGGGGELAHHASTFPPLFRDAVT